MPSYLQGQLKYRLANEVQTSQLSSDELRHHGNVQSWEYLPSLSKRCIFFKEESLSIAIVKKILNVLKEGKRL